MALLLRPSSIVAQLNTLNATNTLLKEEKNKFFQELSKSQLDPNITSRLKHFAVFEVDSIQKAINSDKTSNDAEKEKAIRSLFSFLKVLSNNIYQPRLEMYDIPGTLESYKRILRSLLHHKPIIDELSRISSWSSQLLAMSFGQYKEYDLIEDVATYKRVSSSPDYILQFLENKPTFRFADSLLLTVAAYDPMKMSTYILKNGPALQERIRNKRNIYVQQMVSLAGDRNAPELMPFVVQLAEDRITREEIIKKRSDVKTYFQFLVDELKEELNEPAGPSSIFHNAMRNGIKAKSFAFYVNEINELHSSADAIRFASVKDLRPEDLYYIITSSEDEMYTSSYLGLYKRLVENFSNGSADSIFTLVNYDNFRSFMRIAANYNTLTDFLNRMPLSRAADLIKLFISGIEKDTNTGLEKAMDVADSFTGLDSAVIISELIRNEIGANLIRCVSGQLHFGSRLYNILLQVFDLVKQKDPKNELWSFLGNYEKLDRKELEDKTGAISELVLFYGDEDGTASFNNFLALFKDTTKWQTSKNEHWVSIRSISDKPINIYANLPLDYKQELDLKTQDALVNFLDQQSIQPSVVVHRGHSYHINKTLKKLKPSVKLVILGSCGGNKNIISVASISPDAQIIVSKKTGSKLINDPLIDVINENLLINGGLIWTEVWQQLSGKFSKDAFTLTLFNEYIPPSKNVSLFVLKLFNSYKKFA